MRRLIPVVLVLALGGCGERELVVESNAGWLGTITTEENGSERVVGGIGDTTFAGLGGGRICWSFRMNDPRGQELRVYMAVPTITGTAERGTGTTRAFGGTVAGCSG